MSAGASTKSDLAGTSARSDVDAVIARATFDEKGLLPAIIQQFDTREVLMLGWMDAEALRRTYTTGRVTFWSRSRQEYWRKGDTSGHVQFVREAALDCDGDTLLVQVEQIGAACHTGTRTCFDGDVLAPAQGFSGGATDSATTPPPAASPAAPATTADATDSATADIEGEQNNGRE